MYACGLKIYKHIIFIHVSVEADSNRIGIVESLRIGVVGDCELPSMSAGTKPMPSAGAACACNYLAISLASQHYYKRKQRRPDIKTKQMGCRQGSMVKSTGCSDRGL